MGCGNSQPLDETTKKIDAELRDTKKQLQSELKLLLLGKLAPVDPCLCVCLAWWHSFLFFFFSFFFFFFFFLKKKKKSRKQALRDV